MTISRSRRLAAGALGAATALATLAMAPAAQAGTRDGQPPAYRDTSVTVGRLVLEPTERGYRGSVPLTVSYRGRGSADLQVTVAEPVAGAFADIDTDLPCWFGTRPGELRRDIHCGASAIRGGEHRTYTIDFEVLTSTRAYPMSVDGGAVTVQTRDAQPATVTDSFQTLFRSTTGSLRDPRPYVQDTRTDASVTAGAATLVRQPDGSYLGRVPVTVRYGGDAPHDMLQVETQLPAGVQLRGIEPGAVCAGTWCEVPGGRFMPGEERSVEVLVGAPAGTAPGDLGTGSIRLHAGFLFTELSDVDPSDNTAGFAVTAVDGAA
ncbi:hypothetical protein O7626_29700 [Micromonospora sp. WMMD1102]|uniref:hypothetical protein n=1 Tax=Micromonospora sp. WMMD1102 TaxID=3016105 RepID=UPI0024152359|nr:hypothetical protein [Micromonospora sp. WMMD1102]MDG4790047.1 hypothetical protein [Micromonospora sp. WMMD1102]